MRDEYADLLLNKEYTPEKISQWQKKAMEWLLQNGGVVRGAELLAQDKAPADAHVAELARRIIINSDVFTENISRAD